MKFTPKSESEVNAGDLWPAGSYDFQILSAEEATSKSGNEMIKLKVRLYNDDGQTQVVFDYLLESVAYKLRHICEACGLMDRYESGELAADDFEGKSGRCKVNIQKDKTGQYADKNGIADYIKTEQKQPQRNQSRREMVDDDIPF